MIYQLLLITMVFFIDSCSLLVPKTETKSPQNQKISYGMPYRVQNKIYYPLLKVGNFIQDGVASWYGPKFHGKRTSNNEIYDMYGMTAAHKTLPFNTVVKVVNLKNGREAVVRINDRGPFVNNRIIDLSFSAALKLDMTERGTAQIRLKVLNPNINTLENAKSSRYSVQIGIYREKANSENLVRLISNGRIESVTKEGSLFYKVVIGPYADYKKALKKLGHIQAQGFPEAFIVFD